MSRPDGARTHGPQGGGGLVLVVIAAAVLIGSGAASAIASALVTIIIIIIAVVAALAVVGWIACLVMRARSGHPGQALTARNEAQIRHAVADFAPPRLEATAHPAIEPGREIHLHLNVTPDQLATIMRHHTEEDR